MQSCPAALEINLIDEDLGTPVLERLLTPLLDGREGLLVEVGDGVGGHRCAPLQLGDVLDAPGGDAGEVHFDDGLLDRYLAAAVALDHGGLEGCFPELGHARFDFARTRDELPGVVAARVVLPAGGPHVAPSAHELGRPLVKQGVQSLLDGPPDQILDVVAQRLLVD